MQYVSQERAEPKLCNDVNHTFLHRSNHVQSCHQIISLPISSSPILHSWLRLMETHKILSDHIANGEAPREKPESRQLPQNLKKKITIIQPFLMKN